MLKRFGKRFFEARVRGVARKLSKMSDHKQIDYLYKRSRRPVVREAISRQIEKVQKELEIGQT